MRSSLLVVLALILSGCTLDRAMPRTELATAPVGRVRQAYWDASDDVVLNTSDYGDAAGYRAALLERALNVEAFTDEERDAIRKHKIFQGMDKWALMYSWGAPIGRHGDSSPLGEHEEWVYQRSRVNLYNNRVSWWNTER